MNHNHASVDAPFHEPLHLPQGAIRQAGGSVEWRVWAPKAEQVGLVWEREGRRDMRPMNAEPHGYFSLRESGVAEGARYMYRLGETCDLPDPASRWQPDGVHEASAVFFPEDYPWSDAGWTGVPRDELVVYELHVGTFTPEGTFDAVVPRLGQLKELGVTAVEIMPVGQFPGRRNWGYDGVYPYAVQNSYGGPRALQRLVDAAHHEGMAVLLDVVYNHFGPEGCYLAQFGPYFTDRYHTPWGDAVNFDGPESDPVRRFAVENARMWVRDFHVDGLRLDAVHAIYDFGARHILAELQDGVQEIARRQGRTVHVIAETNQNDVRLIDPPERNGYGLDGMWSDDFHHSVRALLTGNREGYYRDYGRPEHLAKALDRVFVYDGCYSPFRRRRHGSPVRDRDRTKFVVCVHNHDQVGNRALGDRSATYLPEGAQRLACGLLLLSPCVPLLFMGEEYGERRPFPFFCSFIDEDLIEAVRRGRREEFAAMEFEWGEQIPDPQDPATFDSAKLAWQWPEGTFHAKLRRLYADLLAARRRWPGLMDRTRTTARVVRPGADAGHDEVQEPTCSGHGGRLVGVHALACEETIPVTRTLKRELQHAHSPLQRQVRSCTSHDEGPAVLVVERGGERGLVAWANLSDRGTSPPTAVPGGRTCLLSTEAAAYGGARDLRRPVDAVLPFELVVWGETDATGKESIK